MPQLRPIRITMKLNFGQNGTYTLSHYKATLKKEEKFCENVKRFARLFVEKRRRITPISKFREKK